jgi:serine kinase of HPr protein (carbohydrate metabolism regulator)
MSEWVHATAVVADGRGILIRGASGMGKSLLGLRLIERGGRLISDDRVHLSVCSGRIVAAPPYTTHGRMELRGRGILSLPHERAAVISLLVDIVAETDLERVPEAHHLTQTLLGVPVPRQPVPSSSDRALALITAAIEAL